MRVPEIMRRCDVDKCFARFLSIRPRRRRPVHRISYPSVVNFLFGRILLNVDPSSYLDEEAEEDEEGEEEEEEHQEERSSRR